MRPNRLKERWREDEPTFGVWRSACSAFLTEHLAAVGFDWLLVDGEHSAVDLQTMVQMFQAISTAVLLRHCAGPKASERTGSRRRRPPVARR